jgi:FtsH-binding integral membrane protein
MNTLAADSSYDAGLRAFMLGIYNRMTAALVITGATAWLVSKFLAPFLMGWTGILFMLLPIAFVLVLSFGIVRLSYSTANILFWAFSASMGISMSTIFLTFTSTSIASVFFITAATFGAASLYGYATSRDLTSMGTFLFVGLIGVVIASVVNIWLASPILTFVVSVIGVIVFVGLTAYDTQNLKNDYYSNGEVYGFDSPAKSSLYGALSLYLNFVNIFQMLLNLIGDRE